MNKSIYRKTLHTLLAAFDDYKSGNINLECYQVEILKAEREIVSVEEKELRSLLQNHENQLELIRFTTGDENSIHAEVDKFRKDLCMWY